MFCSNCGKQISDNAGFCPYCGTPQRPVSQGGMQRPVGFSDRFFSPEFQAALKASKKSTAGCATVFILAPLIIMAIWGIFSRELEYIYMLFIGGCISAVFFVISLIVWGSKKLERQWDGSVVDKKITSKTNWHKHDGRDYVSETHYQTIVRRDDGKKHVIDEKGDSTAAYSYFHPGERLRYHPESGLLFPYEKFDKSMDQDIVCVFCRHTVSLADDLCSYCGKPLLK